jgi:catechol 2,3-dioxygenase-like lactoylglutathione lyase family enzyme
LSYVVLATENFDDVAFFYGKTLGFALLEQWDRPRGRGSRFDLGGGLKLEILDNRREVKPLLLTPPGERLHLVIEVLDINAARAGISLPTPAPQRVSWGALLFQLKDPDGIAVTYLQWVPTEPALLFGS